MRIIKTFPFQLICVSTAVLLVAVLLVSALIFGQYQASMVEQSEQVTLQSFVTTERNINRQLNGAHKAALLVAQRPEVDGYLFGTFATEAQRVTAQRAMMNVISEALADDYYLSGVLFFRDDGRMVGATEPWRFSYEVEAHPFFERAGLAGLPVEPRITWLGGYRLEDFTLYPNDPGQDDRLLIVGARKTRYSYSSTGDVRTSTMVVAVGARELLSSFEYLDYASEDVLLLDGQGRQLAAKNLGAMGGVPWFYGALDLGASYGSVNADLDGARYQLIYYRMPETGWLLVKQIPFEVYTDRVNRLRAVTLTTAGIVLLGVLGLHTLWAMRFSRPLKQTGLALERARNGDLSVRMTEPSGIYEYELMRTEFNRMIQSIQELLARTKSLEHERITLELQNLQSKLNPHMIFNSITAIRWMAAMSGADKVSDMLVELAELIRPVFAEWRLTWTLREELAYVRHYVRLLQLRYSAVFTLEVHVPDEMLALELPCFTLQPLLENSCEHGARPEKPIHIQLDVEVEGDGIALRVRDNGRGMTEEMTEALRLHTRDADMPDGTVLKPALGHSGIGLRNVHRRLRMYGGEGCGLTIQSEAGVGTCITVRVRRPKLD